MKVESTADEKKLLSEMEDYLKSARTTEESKERGDDLLRRLSVFSEAENARLEKRAADHQLAAQRLAYLAGDDAVRAKVHFIATEIEGSGDGIGLMLIDGLPNSRNKQLQLDLLQSAWRDPNNLPTYELHTALRVARDIVRGAMPNNDEFGGTDEDRKAAVNQYQKDLSVIIETLPHRAEANRSQTIDILRKIAIPNPFNQPDHEP